MRIVGPGLIDIDRGRLHDFNRDKVIARPLLCQGSTRAECEPKTVKARVGAHEFAMIEIEFKVEK